MSLDLVRLWATGEVMDADLAEALGYPMLEHRTPAGQVEDPTAEGTGEARELEYYLPHDRRHWAIEYHDDDGEDMLSAEGVACYADPENQVFITARARAQRELRAAEVRALNDDFEAS
ncbi:MAG: hypothetical protein ABW135_11645 [Thermoleophilaceae bacterium]